MDDHSVGNVKKFEFTISEKYDIVDHPEEQKETQASDTSTYTVEEAIEKIGFGPFQMFIFFFCGILWTADAMEVMILSILSPAVKRQWDLSGAEEAIITSVVFAGALIGSLCWGLVGDHYGRKTTLLLSNIVVFVSGVLSAIPLTADDARILGYPWLLLFRFGVGFGVAGITQLSPYYIEFLPCKLRAVCTVFVAGWWAVGTMLGAALATAVMHPDGLGWHWYLGLCAVPVGIGILFFPFVPESARYCVVQGNLKKAGKIIKRVAWFNFKSLPNGKLVADKSVTINNGTGDQPTDNQVTKEDVNEDESHPLLADEYQTPTEIVNVSVKNASKIVKIGRAIALLFRKGMWKVTLILSFLWFGSAWLYYGNVLLTSTILQENPHCAWALNITDLNETAPVNGSCEDVLGTDDYLKIMWTTSAELPGLLATIVIIEIVGRKLTMAFNFIMIMISFCLLYICTSEILLTFFLFIGRAFATGVFQTMFVYTPEVYPTKVRGFGLSVLNSISRIGAIVTPYIAQVLFHPSDYATITVYAASSLVLVVVSLLLPIETKGKSLSDG